MPSGYVTAYLTILIGVYVLGLYVGIIIISWYNNRRR